MHDDQPHPEPIRRADRRTLYDTAVRFRAPTAMVDAAALLAEQRGMSLAELMRHELRLALDSAPASGRISPDGSYRLTQQPSPMKRAASGDIHAQRELITVALLAWQTNPSAWPDALREAESWARIAAANGSDQDYATLVSVLALRINDARLCGDTQTHSRLEAEGIAIVSVLADEGNEEAAAALPALSEEADADLMGTAKAMVAMWRTAS